MSTIATSTSLCARIAFRFCAPEYATAFEVRNATGHNRVTRYCDAMAFSLFPSRGLSIHGMEVKVSRTDWVKELKTPHKAEEIARHCDFWSLVVSDPEIVKEGELPKNWGLMIPDPKGSGLRTVKAPKELQTGDAAMDRTIDRGFVFSLLRNIIETTVPKKLVEQQIAARATDSQDWRVTNAERGEKNANEALEKLTKTINDFRDRTGLDVGAGRYDFEEHCKVVQSLLWILRNGGPVKYLERMERMIGGMDDLQKDIKTHMDVIRQAIKREPEKPKAPNEETEVDV